MGLRIFSLIIKELLAVWADPKSRFILLGPPVIELVLFSYAATQEVKNVKVAVLNEDTGTLARDLVARIEGSPNFREVVHLRAVPDITQAIDSRSVLMVVHIREDFSRQVAAGLPAAVQLILDGRSSNSSQILAGYAEAIIDGYAAELAQAQASPPPASTVVVRALFNPNLDALWSTVPSLVAILVAIEGLMVTALSVAREREMGTFEQLLVSPLSPLEIIVGKTVPAMLIGLGEGTLVVAVARLYFRVPLTGSLGLLYAAMVAYLLAVVGIGLFISSLALTQQQAILGTFATMVPMVLLSGFASPVENMPDWLQTATLANPVRHFVVIVKGVFLKAMPAADVLHSLWPLAVLAVLTLSAATWLFRRRTE
jgi:ABC-2 type transport system permease protein